MSIAQIRYCLAEDMRLDAAKPIVNQYVGTEVDRYNAMVGDYNSRCSEFKYRRGDLQAARKEVQQYQSKLQTEGRSRFAAAATARRGKNHAERQLVRSIQQALNAQGYGVGQADGIAGEKTRSAIRSFQRDMSLPVDGKPSRKLLLYLQSADSLEHQQVRRPSTVQVRPDKHRSRPDTNSDHIVVATKPRSDPRGFPRATSGEALSELTYDEKSAIELACIVAKGNGAASYNRCLQRQLNQLASAPREPSLAGLTYDEKSAIKLACIVAKGNGAASYNRCLRKQLSELKSAPREPSLAGLTYDEKSAVKLACIVAKGNGAASYNRCLQRQLSQLASAPREPNLAGLTYDEKSAIRLACIVAKGNGAASYNRCLVRQLESIGD